MSVISSAAAGLASPPSSLLTRGKIENVTIALANTEQSHTFPAYTKQFSIQARGSGKILMSYDVGTSGTVYRTIWAGTYSLVSEIGSAATTIYFQSPIAGLVVELESWV